MFEFDGVLGLVLVGLWIHAIVDVVRTDESQVRHLPKQTWLFLVISLPDIGALVWMAAGRPERPVARFAEYNAKPVRRRPLGPEDRADFAAWFDATKPGVAGPDTTMSADLERERGEDPPQP